jgi:mRNA-degrading endonuclease toxin of MazEF toxin-antitoxin module
MKFNLDNMYCGAIRRGDVVLLEPEPGKEIPVLALQDDMLNQTLATVICAIIEPTARRAPHVNEVILKADETGLGADGIVRTYDLVTVDRRHIVAKKAELPKARIHDIFSALDVTFGRFRDRRSS